MFLNTVIDKDKKTKEKQEEKQEEKQKKDKPYYGFCRWNDHKKIDRQGTNCPEYLFFSIFQEMMK